MSDTNWIEWIDPVDNKLKYFALSSDTGIYWTEDTEDPLIVDVSELPVKDSIDNTLTQISEKYKMGKGRQYERFNLFKHPDPKVYAYLAVEKLPNGTRDEDTNKVNRSYSAYFTHKFKRVTCISRITGRPQGNPSMQNKDYARKSSIKAKEERKRKLASAQETAKKLNFDPLKRLALYAMGDSERLGLKEDIRPSLQLKSLEIYLKYSHQQMKAFSPQEMEKLRGADNGPRINIVLPADGSENNQHVLEHKDTESLEQYLKTGSKKSYDAFEMETSDYGDDEEFEEVRCKLDIPDEE